MRRMIPVAGLAALALFPASALASTSRAKVLSVDRRHHRVELVDATRAARAYRYRGVLPRLGLGDTVTYRRAGHFISHVRRTARAMGTISFYARVVGSGPREVRLRLGDGSPFSLSSQRISSRAVAHAAASAPPVTVQVLGLAPGETVLISETVDAHGHWTVTITVPSSGPSPGTTGSGDGSASSGDAADDRIAEGTVTRVSETGLAISTGPGQLSFSVDDGAGLTEGFLVGDRVDVTYSTNADGTLRADDVEYVEQEETGVVSAVGDGSLTLGDQGSGQPVTFTADPAAALFADVAPGDQVDVTYHQSADGDVADAVDDYAWGG